MKDSVIKKNEIKNIITNAFNKDPLIVSQYVADVIYEEFFFIPISQYVHEYLSQLVPGEIGIFNGRRIVINLPMKRK